MTPPVLIRRGVVGLFLALLAGATASTPTLAAPGDRSPDGVWREADPNAVQSDASRFEFESGSVTRRYQLDDLALFTILRDAPLEFTAAATPSSVVLSLPMPDGTFARFRIAESPILSEKLARANPEIRTYVAQGIDNPAHTARFDRTPLGFHAIVVTPGEFVFIERATNGPSDVYVSFRKGDLVPPDGVSCAVSEQSGPRILAAQGPPSGANLRTYDLAVVTTSEFTAFYGGFANTQAAVTQHINTVNAVYEAEVAIRFLLVCTTMYNDAPNDPFDDPDTVDGDLLNQSDATLDANCGANDYEIGHLFHRRAGAGNSGRGLAQLGVVCGGSKGRAASTATMPNQPLFPIDLLCHEMGHQFNANHSYNSTAGGCVERVNNSAFEIGSGTTLMSYACAGCTNEDPNPGCADAYFHTHSFDEITDFREAGGNCGAQTATGNTPPTVNAGSDYTIPRGTPFTLTASGSDPDGDAVTWCWEQYDLGAASPPLNGNVSGPLFRSFLPVASPSRTFPNLPDLLAGNPTPFEILPTADRNLSFRATVRDNRAGGGGVNRDQMEITVTGDPFFLTSPNGGQSLNAGCTTTVEWTVGGGSVAANVNILFSTDGGATFPTTLASGVANDGSHDVLLPCVATTQTDARIKIEGAGNIFFDISDDDFTVTPQAPLAGIKAPVEVEVGANCSVDIPVSGSVTDDCGIAAADVTFTADVLGNAATAVVNITAVQNGDTEVTFSGTVTVSDLTSCPAVVRIGVQGTDNCSLVGSDLADVTVLDTTPPEIMVTLNREFLWPPNHKLADITATVEVTDNCAGTSFVLTSITSNEPADDDGDGSTSPDIVDAAFGTPDLEFKLRSERMGPGSGRVYTILYTATDNCGNSTPAEAEVRVEHDQSGHAIVVQVGQGEEAVGTNYLAVVVPGTAATSPDETPVDRGAAASRRLEPATGLIVGNTAGVVGPSVLGRADVDGDGLPDAIALFALSKAEAIRGISDLLDGPVGLHYRNVFGESYLVPDLLAVPREDLSSTMGEAVFAAIGEDALAAASVSPSLAQRPEAGTPAAEIGEVIATATPSVTRLAGFRPNPFLHFTAVAFELARPARVKLEVYSPAGARVRGLAERAYDPGRHAVTWDGRDEAGRRVPPGVYFVRFVGDGVVETGKALLLP